MKRFKRVYIEITNVCNLNCSFCPKTLRAPKSLNIEEFNHIIKEVKPLTNHLYFHVMGEPLIHKNLEEFLSIANSNNLQVNLTTNGTNILAVQNILLKNKPRKISFSLHSFEGNVNSKNLEVYIENITNFTKAALEAGIIIEFRLWNKSEDATALNKLNAKIINLIKENLQLNEVVDETLISVGGITLVNNCYLGFDNVFAWPDEDAGINNENVYCLALKNQIAILSDGTVVPCCLDNNGAIKLGNIFDNSLKDIIGSNLAKSIVSGFQNKKAICNLCKNCGYAKSKFN